MSSATEAKRYGMVIADKDGNLLGDGQAVVENDSLDFLITEFVKEGGQRAKDAGVGIAEFCGKCIFHALDLDGNCHASIMGVYNENVPNGVFVVHQKIRNQITMYDWDGNIVGRNRI